MQPVILMLGAVAVVLPVFLVTKAVVRKRPDRRDRVAATATGCAALCFGAIALGQNSGSIGAIAVSLACFSAIFWHRHHRREFSEQERV